MSTQEHIEALTEGELKMLQTPIKDLRQTGLLPTALQALDKKFSLNRMENDNQKSA